MDSLIDGDPLRVGPYRVTARLGAGGMGQVYLGLTPTGRTVALKLLKPELAARTVFRQRFAREVAAAKQISGRHTARVIDADPRAEAPWLATAYVAGPTLHELVRDDGPLSVDALRVLGAALAAALAAIHDRGLIHRDLKPRNVIIGHDGPRIIDFGVAQTADVDHLTGDETVVGTHAYTSPERLRADQVTPASDVFTLGSALVFAATGRGPFDAASIPQIAHRVATETPDLDEVPGEIREVIGACLAKDPGDRPSSATIANRLLSDKPRRCS